AGANLSWRVDRIEKFLQGRRHDERTIDIDRPSVPQKQRATLQARTTTPALRSVQTGPCGSPGRRASGASMPILARHIWWVATLLLGSAVGAVGWTIWQMRTDAIQSAISDTGNIAAIMAGQFSRSLHSIDDVLLEVEKSARERDLDTPEEFRAVYRRPQVHEALKQHLVQLPRVFNLVIAGEDGQVISSTASWPPRTSTWRIETISGMRARPVTDS